jgi:hypothetical protein
MGSLKYDHTMQLTTLTLLADHIKQLPQLKEQALIPF